MIMRQLVPKVVLAAAVLPLLAACGDVWPPAESQDSLRQALADPAARKPPNYFECAGIGGIGFKLAEADGPLYFFEPPTGKLISVCGGACKNADGWLDPRSKMCRAMCPPPAWEAQNCTVKRLMGEAFYLKNVPAGLKCGTHVWVGLPFVHLTGQASIYDFTTGEFVATCAVVPHPSESLPKTKCAELVEELNRCFPPNR